MDKANIKEDGNLYNICYSYQLGFFLTISHTIQHFLYPTLLVFGHFFLSLQDYYNHSETMVLLMRKSYFKKMIIAKIL